MRPPKLPDTARQVLKGLIVSLGTAGIVSSADAEHLLRYLGLEDA
jgi:hypothetical protein